MSISKQEPGSGEYISIKQVWLNQIDRCNESLSNYLLKIKDGYEHVSVMAASACVDVLVINLVDYGDAPIKTEYISWWKEIREKYASKNDIVIAEAKLEKVLQILNKYQMLHESLPRGYTNVILEGITKEELDE